jgi:hypothetical protein
MRAENGAQRLGRNAPSRSFTVTVRRCGFAVNQVLVTGGLPSMPKKGVNQPPIGANSGAPVKQN